MISPLHTRLFHACACAYEIDQAGPFPVEQPGCPLVGFTSEPQALFEGKVNYCLVGRIPEGLLVAFRGTLYPFETAASIHDWIQDFHAGLIPLPNQAGSVHSGFWSALETLWPALGQALDSLDPQRQQPLFFTGHSKGGALAPLAAWRAATEWKRPIGQVVTFGAPRVGDGIFRKQYEALNLSHWRYEHANDPVPHLPPVLRLLGAGRFFPIFDYQHLGTLIFQPAQGIPMNDSAELQAKRDMLLGVEFTLGPVGLVRMVADHGQIVAGIIKPCIGYLRATQG